MKSKRKTNRKKAPRALPRRQHIVPKHVSGYVVYVDENGSTVFIESHPDSDHAFGEKAGSALIFGDAVYTLHHGVEIPHPPKRLQRVLTFFLRAEEREGALGDLAEKYHTRYWQVGPQQANRWFAFQVLRSLLPLLVRLSERIVWVILGEWIKKHIS